MKKGFFKKSIVVWLRQLVTLLQREGRVRTSLLTSSKNNLVINIWLGIMRKDFS